MSLGNNKPHIVCTGLFLYHLNDSPAAPLGVHVTEGPEPRPVVWGVGLEKVDPTDIHPCQVKGCTVRGYNWIQEFIKLRVKNFMYFTFVTHIHWNLRSFASQILYTSYIQVCWYDETNTILPIGCKRRTKDLYMNRFNQRTVTSIHVNWSIDYKLFYVLIENLSVI